MALLRQLGADFSKKYPVLAPMLAGQSADPDVERLLEGTAFLTGQLEERLDDDFPELVHGLTELMFPNYLHPIPSATIIKFFPKDELSVKQVVPSHTELRSREIEGTECRYSTAQEVEVYPLSIEITEKTDSSLTLGFKFSQGSLSFFNIDKLKLFISGDYGVASEMMWLLSARCISVEYQDGNKHITLSAKEAITTRSQYESSIIPYKEDSFNAFRIVQEYFQLEESFLFFDIFNLSKLASNENEFEVKLNFQENYLLKLGNNDFKFELFCVPALNIFKYEAETIAVDYKKSEYRVMAYNNSDFEVYSVDRVVGFIQGTVEERKYEPFLHFNPQSKQVPVYSLKRRKSKLVEGTDVYISVVAPRSSDSFATETLVLDITCTNGNLADKLQLGDINQVTPNVPLFIGFSNITQPTSTINCPLGNNLLWRLLSHIYLNQKSVATVEALTSLLKLYIFTDTSNKLKVQLNTKKVECIKAVRYSDATRLINGAFVRGAKINIDFDSDSFASFGDMYIFANVIQGVLGDYTGINSFTIVEFTDLSTGDTFKCRELQLGSRKSL